MKAEADEDFLFDDEDLGIDDAITSSLIRKLLREKSLEPRARFPLTPYTEPQLTYSETLPSSPHMVLSPDERP